MNKGRENNTSQSGNFPWVDSIAVKGVSESYLKPKDQPDNKDESNRITDYTRSKFKGIIMFQNKGALRGIILQNLKRKSFRIFYLLLDEFGKNKLT